MIIFSICNKGVCDCLPGYRGKYCDERYVVHGKLLDDNVYCDYGWTGISCEEKCKCVFKILSMSIGM